MITSGGAAIVVDGKRNAKALTVLGGTEDHFHELRSYFDDTGRVRFLFVKYADVHGAISEHIVYFNANGVVGVCHNLQLGEVESSWDLCTDETLRSTVDPEVDRATRTTERHVPRNRLRDELSTLDPHRVYEECATNADLVTSTEQRHPLVTGKGGCLGYEPETVVVRGTLERASSPGPPNYSSIAQGDVKETYWLLRLDRPACVDASGEFSDQAHSDIREIQLVFLEGSGVYQRYRRLLGRSIEARGTLFGAHSGHHHTEVLLTVGALVPSTVHAK